MAGFSKKKLKAQAKQLGIEENIIFTGLVSTENIPVLLKVMDMVVHVSLREGLPRVIPQAFLSERPVVAFDIDGAHDIIQDGVNGYLVQPKNIEILADRILKLVQNPRLRSDFCLAGKKVALELFSKEKMVRDITALYDEFLVSESSKQVV